MNNLLDIFGVTGVLELGGNGYVLDKNKNVVGSIESIIELRRRDSEPTKIPAEVYEFTDQAWPLSTELYCCEVLKTSFFSNYGKVTSKMFRDLDNLRSWKHEFNLENSLGNFSCVLSGMNFDLPHTKMEFKLEKKQDNKPVEKICICDNNKYFYYNNLITSEEINIMKVKRGRAYRFNTSKKEDKNTKELFIMSNILGTQIQEVSLYHNGEHQDIRPYIKQFHINLPIWQQMTDTINLVYPDVYGRITEIIRNYDYNGTNIIETAIERAISPTMSREQLKWCYGEEIAKKLMKKGI